MVYLCQSDALMVDVTVFEQAPQLQAGQQEGVIRGAGVAKSAVETIDGPELSVLPQHHKLHLLHESQCEAGTGVKIKQGSYSLRQITQVSFTTTKTKVKKT